MQDKHTSRYKLLERTGIRETATIGNSRRAIVANSTPSTKRPSQRKVAGCRGCSRKQRKH